MGARLNLLRGYADENGAFLLVQKSIGALARRTRNRLLAKKLNTHGFQIGRHPSLAGLAHMRIGKNFSAGDGLWLEAVTSFAGVQYEPLITIGANVSVSHQVHVACTNQVAIGDGVLMGSHVIITDHSHGRYAGQEQSSPEVPPNTRRLSNDKGVIIQQNVWIGDGVAVLGGADIGEGTIVGANSVVTGKLPAYCIAVGTPARPIRKWNFEKKQWIAWWED
jgi:acetyltransferase-like isoleucine patch superfamily enzyme